MIKLYQFPISHFCEKIRWVLSHKKLEYKLINLLPGFHAKKMLKLSGKHSVPVLSDEDGADQIRSIANSNEIISYLDKHYLEYNLTPTDEALKQQALEWEALADSDIGPHVRRICYHTLLQHPNIVVSFLTHGGPWYGRYVIKFIFPKLQEKMRKLMNINAISVAESEVILETALTKINQHLKGKLYLVGDQFSRADIAVAALLAPLFSPQGYGLDWPAVYPEPLKSYIDKNKKALHWAETIYQKHR